MSRTTSSGFVALGLAAVLALGAFLGSGLSYTPKAEALTAVTVGVAFSNVTSCTATVTATARDGAGAPATDATIYFSTTMGSITPSAAAVGGVASATLTITTTTGGSAVVTATSGTAMGSNSQAFNCSSGCLVSNCYDYCNVYGVNNCNNCNSAYYYSGCNPCATNYNYNCGYNCGIATYAGCYNSCNTVYNYNCGYNNCTTPTNYGCTYSNCTPNAYSYCNAACTAFNASCNPCSGLNNCTTACGSYGYNACVSTNPCTYVGTVYSCGGTTSTAYATPGSRISILPGPSSVTCGGATNITAVVYDAAGLRVPDGTPVTFSTTLGSITSPDPTQGGTAIASLTIPGATSGTANITVASGGATGSTSVAVSCAPAAPAAAVPVAVAPVAVAPIQRVITPPSTGDAGLLPLD